VLEVDSRSEGEFGEHDIAFLQGAANILGMAIEQQQYQRKLQAALDRHQILLKEVNHRVKNSLQVVSSMLHLQANTVGDPALSERLMEASTRILAVGRAYNRLAYNADYENIDLVGYLREVVEDLEAAVAPCKIQLDTPKEIQFAADRAILVALIVNELILNAGRHAYPDSPDGVIRLQLVLSDDKAVSISVSDDGVGLPADFNPALTKRLGTRIVQALAGQLGAELTRQESTGGTHLTLVVPLHAAAN
jgi:two-component sensor histidine kinase